MHEVFLQRLAAHPTLRQDHNFFVFLEYGQDVSWARALGSLLGAGGWVLDGLKPLSHQRHKWHEPGVRSANAYPNILLSVCAAAECPRKEQEGAPWGISEEYR